MGAVPLGSQAYITRAPPWSKSQFKIGTLAYPPGTTPPHLRPFLLKPGDVQPHVARCRSQGKAGASLVRCVFGAVGNAKAR